jgi:hypothetical protein
MCITRAEPLFPVRCSTLTKDIIIIIVMVLSRGWLCLLLLVLLSLTSCKQ